MANEVCGIRGLEHNGACELRVEVIAVEGLRKSCQSDLEGYSMGCAPRSKADMRGRVIGGG